MSTTNISEIPYQCITLPVYFPYVCGIGRYDSITVLLSSLNPAVASSLHLLWGLLIFLLPFSNSSVKDSSSSGVGGGVSCSIAWVFNPVQVGDGDRLKMW